MSVIFDPIDHRYTLDGKELISVTRLIREQHPIQVDYSRIDPAVLEFARDRGVKVDAYFGEYLRTGAVTIAKGETQEVLERTKAVIDWWESVGAPPADPQVILTDGEVAGQTDWISGGTIYEMKNTSKIDPTYHIQVGAYAELASASEGFLVHVTNKGVKVIKVDLWEAMEDWRALKRRWKMGLR